ncbi:MAG TPA: glyoxalase/bleomycin resistance/extradiol dioxygenase family protein [Bryobacteraceae bacterium]|nr:glyoxalase/bleomycin resistance/extradiol dioxygenase family protein [Bryobacteraceae bacterium]
MPIEKLNPYIMLNGTAEKAIHLYESALGAKTEGLSHFGDMPGFTGPPEVGNRVMHALLHIGGGVVMVSDASPDRTVPATGNVDIALDFTDVADMAKAFEGLAAGGNVTMALTDTFWGARFGMLTDAYGVGWMFNCDLKKAQA